MSQVSKKTKSGLTVTIDLDLCIGAASCVAVAPTVYELNADGKAILTDVDSVDEETLLNSAKSCPVNAVIIKDKEGKVIWPK